MIGFQQSEFWDHFSGLFFPKVSVSHILNALLLLKIKFYLPYNNTSKPEFLLYARHV